MNDDVRMMFKIAKKYYILHLSQEEIAVQENISKSTVSRILAKAEKLGYISYNLNFPLMNAESLEEEMKETFKLKHVFVSAVTVEDPIIILNDVAQGLSVYLNKIVKDGEVIGVSWGNTMNAVASQLNPMPLQDVCVVQLNGGISRNIIPTNAEQIVSSFANNYKGVGYILPVPAFVDSKRIVEALHEDSRIREVFELMERARIAVFSIGSIDPQSILISAGYFTTEQYADLHRKGFVADICTRYFDIHGQMPETNINERVLGIDPNSLKTREHTICIAVGMKKVDGILGVIRGGYANTLFTDEITARELLTRQNESLS